jgi:NADH:ubiquinone oxidoreductase subunit K
MTSAALWPWLTLIGLGLYHGANPAMGWLFAVALGLQRGSERVVLLSVLPIALGHAAAVAAVLFGVLTLGLFIDRVVLIRLMGIALFGWAFWLALYGHRHPVRIGMQTGLLGLVLWSFLMASGHGAGLMLIPALAPICGSLSADAAMPTALAALGLHSTAMLLAVAAISVAVYIWIGVDFLRRGWINLDIVWVLALGICGVVLLVT